MPSVAVRRSVSLKIRAGAMLATLLPAGCSGEIAGSAGAAATAGPASPDGGLAAAQGAADEGGTGARGGPNTASGNPVGGDSAVPVVLASGQTPMELAVDT